jgi:hypothetical protein
VADRDGGLAVADPSSEPPELGGEVGVFGVRRGERCLVEDLAEPSASLRGLAGAPFATGDVVAWTDAGPRGEVGGGREAGHVVADLGDDALGGSFADPGDGVEPVTGPVERDHHPVDLGVERADRPLEVVDVVERDPQDRRVVLTETSPQCLLELGDLVAQRRLGQVSEHDGVSFPVDQRLQHQAARDTQHVRGDGVELDPGVLQHFLHPLLLGGVGLDQPFAVAGEIAQFADRCRRHERP